MKKTKVILFTVLKITPFLFLSCNSTTNKKEKNAASIAKFTVQKQKNMDDIETQKKGYVELINLCVGGTKKKELINFIDTLQNNLDENTLPLYIVINHLDETGTNFIMALDWKQEIADLVWRVNSSLKDNFNTTINLPDPNKYGEDASVSAKNVFTDFDKVLRTKSFQLGFIDTESDEYVIIVHKVKDEDEVKNAIKKIGYYYLTAYSPNINNEN